jgi:hypothetical protein
MKDALFLWSPFFLRISCTLLFWVFFYLYIVVNAGPIIVFSVFFFLSVLLLPPLPPHPFFHRACNQCESTIETT